MAQGSSTLQQHKAAAQGSAAASGTRQQHKAMPNLGSSKHVSSSSLSILHQNLSVLCSGSLEGAKRGRGSQHKPELPTTSREVIPTPQARWITHTIPLTQSYPQASTIRYAKPHKQTRVHHHLPTHTRQLTINDVALLIASASLSCACSKITAAVRYASCTPSGLRATVVRAAVRTRSRLRDRCRGREAGGAVLGAASCPRRDLAGSTGGDPWTTPANQGTGPRDMGGGGGRTYTDA